jgi:hypothetical protein
MQRAGDGIRTHDNDVGNVVLYQLSYTRIARIAHSRAVQAAMRSVKNRIIGQARSLARPRGAKFK